MILPPAYDWHYAYRPATLALLSGHSPYSITTEYFANAPWVLLPLAPLALLPEDVGRFILVLVGLVSFFVFAVKIGAKPIGLVAFLLSPQVLQCLYYGQIDFMPLLGILFPPQIGLFFAVIKPQVGIGLVIFWLIEAWNSGRARQVAKTFAPVTIALVLSVVVFGLWPMNWLVMRHSAVNTSIWPYGIVLGIALLFKSLKNKNLGLSIGASPLLSPYVLQHSWVTVLSMAVKYDWLMVTSSIAMWVVYILRIV